MTDQASGQQVNIEVWFESERSLLFDYLVRMTGDVERSRSEAVDVIQAIKKSLREPVPHQEMRCHLYRTARSFNADCWFRSPLKLLDQVYLGTNRQQDLRRIETYVDQLIAADREMTLLRYRYGFLSTEIAKIVGRPVQQVQSTINQSVLALRREQPDIDLNQLKQFPLFPMMEFETATMAIEEIVEKISKPWLRQLRKLLIWSLIMFGGLAGAFYQWPELMDKIQALDWKSWLSLDQ